LKEAINGEGEEATESDFSAAKRWAKAQMLVQAKVVIPSSAPAASGPSSAGPVDAPAHFPVVGAMDRRLFPSGVPVALGAGMATAISRSTFPLVSATPRPSGAFFRG
jgi:hypothetical protein